jgi:glycerol uptake facilitator-like aquaporin
MLLRSLIVEAFGVFSLCYIGGMAVMSGNAPLAVGFAHAIVLGFCICLGGPISGGQFNPAVTVPLILTGDMPPVKGLLYIAAQCGGSLLAGFISLEMKWKGSKAFGVGYPSYNASNATVLQAFLAEVTATFFLVLAVYTGIRTGRDEKTIGTWVGGILVAMVIAVGNISGASLNPCRTLGPALFSGGFTKQKANWLYYAGPITGGVAAGLLSSFVFHPSQPVKSDKEKGLTKEQELKL